MITAHEVMDKLDQRLVRKIRFGEPNECWTWQSAVNNKGYSVYSLKIDGKWKTRYVTRLIFEYIFGEFDKKLDVLHTCDNPPCVNPNHLFTGTAKDNVADMFKKGRDNIPRGSHQGHAKLNEDQVMLIKLKLRYGERNQSEIARKFGVSSTAICSIANEIYWKHVKI